ncbi:SpoIIE family protein phosphatase [Sedimenticola hydrogenitrophicus]|uniref:SpoIIE family protein phosphatase n=1 Tax=Sedimenticola hydrogenitrophicus TaxID=2967975 RepID=UPI0023B088DD|nr:SpoIIE family protein phosphatase [Sedimenticola hydrogenitrophicus]
MSNLAPTVAETRILVVDDESMIRYNIAGYLEDSGYSVFEAEDGLQAIEAVKRQRPDLVLSDLRMPGLDGLEVIGQLHHSHPELPIIAVSGTGVLGDAVDALRAGAWDFVVKPIQDMAVLEHAVTAALGKAQLIRDNHRYQQDLEQANHRLQESLQQMRDDADAGRRIQLQIMPEQAIDLGPYRLSHSLLPSMVLSGDFVDYFSIDRGHFGCYLADVSGHGVSSAFITVLLKSYVNRQLERLHKDNDQTVLEPDRLLTRLNQTLLSDQLEKYLTIFYAVIDTGHNRIKFSIGGHFPSPMLFDGTQAVFLPGRGPPVGLFAGAGYAADTLDLPEHFALAAFSDGILEVLPQPTLVEKKQHLLDALNHFDPGARNLIERLGLREGQSYPDDITLLLLTRDG